MIPNSVSTADKAYPDRRYSDRMHVDGMRLGIVQSLRKSRGPEMITVLTPFRAKIWWCLKGDERRAFFRSSFWLQ